jgi:hypothetical protein
MQKFPPAEILVPEETAREVNNQTQQQQPNQYDKKLPRRCLHALASLAVGATAVKHAEVKNQKSPGIVKANSNDAATGGSFFTV